MKRNDIILLVSILVAAVLLFGIEKFRQRDEEGTWAVVTVNGKTHGKYALSKEQTIEIEGKLGVNCLMISEETAHMESAACPDHYCIKQGEISKAGQQIICLPNEIVVEIEGGKSSSLDATVY